MSSICSVRTYCIKIPRSTSTQWFGEGDVSTLPGTDYYFEDERHEVYSRKIESVLIEVTATDGTRGWGEVQAPILPETGASIIDGLLAPMLLGADSADSERLRDRMYDSMNVRGHMSGFMIDAISGVDIALWDLKGKRLGESVGSLLGGTYRETLPAYVSGVPGTTPAEQAEHATTYEAAGFGAVKTYLHGDYDADVRQVRAIRDAVGPDTNVFVDALWRYPQYEVERLVRGVGEDAVDWLEAPVAPEDVVGHAELTRRLGVPVAAGEQLRTADHFDCWCGERAMDIAQPDVLRCGITEAARIADLAATRNVPVAFHVGSSLGVGMAATWQVASADAGVTIQEHQPICFDIGNRLLESPLARDGGELRVPSGPGLGVEVDRSAVRDVTTDERVRKT